MTGAGRRRFAALLALAALCGGAARLVSWGQVFTHEGVQYIGNDAHYHALRAQQIVDDYPRTPWVDGWINYPVGAPLPWPPLFDQLAASTAMVIGGGNPSDTVVEKVAALVPVVLGALTVPLVGFLAASLLGETVGVAAAFLLALLPAHVMFSALGRFDQHVAEVLLFVGILIALVKSWTAADRGPAAWGPEVTFGSMLALAFWTWPGSALHLLFVAGFVGAWYVVAPAADPSVARMARWLARGGAVGFVLLLASSFLFAPADSLRRMSLVGLSGFHASLVGLAACFGALLWLLRSRSVDPSAARRAAEVIVAASLPAGAAALLIPGWLDAVGHGLTALARGNPWYRNILEFDPMIFAGYQPVAAEVATLTRVFGFSIFVMPLAGIYLVMRWCRAEDNGLTPFFLLAWGASFLLLGLARQRFMVYLAVPAAIYVAFLLHGAAEALAGRFKDLESSTVLVMTVISALVLAPCTAWYRDEATAGPDPVELDLAVTLDWLAGRQAIDPDRQGVFAEWRFGHQIRRLAGKPVLANPFGTDLGVEAMRDASEIFLAYDPAAAAGIMRRREIGFLLLTNPITEAHFAFEFAPAGTVPAVTVTRNWPSTRSVEVQPSFQELLVSRLYFFDGLAAPGSGSAPIEGLRLVYESALTSLWAGLTTSEFKVFEVLPGALVDVLAGPAETVTATTVLTTNQGRRIRWSVTVRTDDTGHASFRLPYATGANGKVIASAFAVSAANRRIEIPLAGRDVEGGRRFTLDLVGSTTGAVFSLR